MEDKIRTLCQKVIETDGNSEEIRIAADELRSALSKHIEHMRKSLKNYPLAQERRSRDQ